MRVVAAVAPCVTLALGAVVHPVQCDDNIPEHAVPLVRRCWLGQYTPLRTCAALALPVGCRRRVAKVCVAAAAVWCALR